MPIEVTRGAVTRLELVRPEQRNALDAAHLSQLAAALAEAGRDPEVRVLVLSGGGEHFSAGADLGEVLALQNVAEGRRYFGQVAEVMTLMRQARQPVVAVVRGWCLAGALGLVGAADFAYAAESARFGLPEVGLGLFPFVISSVLVRQMAWRPLVEMALSGVPADAQAMVRAGLLTAVWPDAVLTEQTEEMIQRLASRPPEAVARGKAALWHMAGRHWQEDLDRLVAEVAVLAQGAEAKRHIADFLARRSRGGAN